MAGNFIRRALFLWVFLDILINNLNLDGGVSMIQKWGWMLLAVLGVSGNLYADDFQFVSVLSAPVGSFDVVETTNKDTQMVPYPDGASNVEFNIGSDAVQSGIVEIKGGPIEIGVLSMQPGTKLTSAAATGHIWAIHDGLFIGSGGTVTAKRLIFDGVGRGDIPTKLEVKEALRVDKSLASSVAETTTLTVKRNIPERSEDAWFVFDQSGFDASGPATATWTNPCSSGCSMESGWTPVTTAN